MAESSSDFLPVIEHIEALSVKLLSNVENTTLQSPTFSKEDPMNRIYTVILTLALCISVRESSQGSDWQFKKVFPDTNFLSPYGVHGLAVAPDGNIWIAPSWATDSVMDAGGVWWPCVQVFVFRPDGTPTSFSGFKFVTVGAFKDTLWNGTQGMRADADGNIVYSQYDTYWRIDYRNGEGLARVIPVKDGYTTSPAFTSANEMFEAYVLPGNPIKIYDNNFTYLGTAVDASLGFSRAFEVSKDGKDIYWAGYTLNQVLIYHSESGTLGTYTLTDSMAFGYQAESFAWNKKNGLLYISGGNIDTTDYGPFMPGHNPMKWMGINPTTKAVEDSIVWNWDAYPYPRTGSDAPRPRVIDFSVSGDTAYVGCFWQDKAAVQMFARTISGVSLMNDRIPAAYSLSQNYPNPFNPSSEIQFAIPKAGSVVLRVYDILGRDIATLVSEHKAPGTYKVVFDGSHLSSGIYLYELKANSVLITKKMLLVK